MPNLTTHIHFALLIFERAQVDIHLPALVEGAVAPGLHSVQDTFTHSHSRKAITGSFDYRLGYLSHSFLDHYFDAYRTEIFLFKSPVKEERMRAMSMAEQIDIMHIKEYETELQSLSEKYGEVFANLYHAASTSKDQYMEIERDYEDLMIGIAKKFNQLLKALKLTPVSNDLIP